MEESSVKQVGKVATLVCSGCNNKMPQTGRHMNNGNFSLTALGAGSAGQGLAGLAFASRFPVTGRKGSLSEGPIPFVRLHPQDQSPPKGPASKHPPTEGQVPTHEFGRDTHSVC